jgi:hypothetical protein
MSERTRPTRPSSPRAISAVVCAVLAMFLLGGCADAVDVAEDSAIDAASATGAPDGDGGGKDGSGADGEGRGDASSQGGDDGPQVRLRLPNPGPPKPVFLTPSRNIGCAISTDSVRCDIVERSYDLPEKPADCDGDFGQSISVGRDGIATFVCVTDTVVDPGAPVLPYGTSTEVGDFGCTSSEAHIACYHLGSEHGFELSRESPALF